MENKDIYEKLHRITKLYLQTLGDEAVKTINILDDTGDFEEISKRYDTIMQTLMSMSNDDDCKRLGKLTDERISILRTFLELEGTASIHNTVVKSSEPDEAGSPDAWSASALAAVSNTANEVYQFMTLYLKMFQFKGLITPNQENRLIQMLNKYTSMIEENCPIVAAKEVSGNFKDLNLK